MAAFIGSSGNEGDTQPPGSAGGFSATPTAGTSSFTPFPTSLALQGALDAFVPSSPSSKRHSYPWLLTKSRKLPPCQYRGTGTALPGHFCYHDQWRKRSDNHTCVSSDPTSRSNFGQCQQCRPFCGSTSLVPSRAAPPALFAPPGCTSQATCSLPRICRRGTRQVVRPTVSAGWG